MFYSKPGTFFFVNRILSWMKRQNERLWCMVPFWDSAGVAMISDLGGGFGRGGLEVRCCTPSPSPPNPPPDNECKAKDLRIICRPGAVAKYLSKGVQVRFDPDGHSKVIVGDTATLLGSFNMSYQSMFDNQENATYSRSKDYADFFLAKWEEAVVPGGHEGER